MALLCLAIVTTLAAAGLFQATTAAEKKCTPEGGVCHFLTLPCCETLTCIRFTMTSAMNGICMLDVHSGDEYNVPVFTTPAARIAAKIPSTTLFTLPPRPTAPDEVTGTVTKHYCCSVSFTCN
ncbi:uncharacterized protein LOC144180373 [Haemaphysalis longicornis]